MPCGSNEVQHFEIDIDETGMKLEAHGFKGNSCVKESARIEAAIGSTEKRKYKDAFYQKVKTIGRNLIGGR